MAKVRAMSKTRLVLAILAAGVSLLADDKPPQVDAWKKPVPEWTVDDAHQIMTDSPWVKTTTPSYGRIRRTMASVDVRRRTGGRGGGIGSRWNWNRDCPVWDRRRRWISGWRWISRWQPRGSPGGNYPDTQATMEERIRHAAQVDASLGERAARARSRIARPRRGCADRG